MTRIKALGWMGVISLVSGLIVLLMANMPVYAQDMSDYDYIGASECASCHRTLVRNHDESVHALTLREPDDAPDALLADFTQGEDVRLVQFPDEDVPRAFTAKDVAFVVGTGRFVQRYLYRVERNDYRVLPAEWDVASQTWQRLDYAEAWDDPAYDWEQNCAYCHVTGFSAERGRWEDDSVVCEACHGPGSEHADLARDAGRGADDEELSEIRAAINPAIDPQTCGQCHSRGLGTGNEPYPPAYVPGGNLSASFTLVGLDQTDHWWATGHANQMNMQYNEWLNSGHAEALVTLRANENADDSCLTCHSADYTYTANLIAAAKDEEREGAPPDPITVDTALYGVTCISCHDPHADAETALPANLTQEPYALCISCHNNAAYGDGVHHPVQEMFEGTAFVDEIPAVVGVHFSTEEGPRCITCHAAEVPVMDGLRVTHNLNPIMPGMAQPDAGLFDSCSTCHSQQVTAAAMQQFIDDVQQSIEGRIHTARTAVTDTTPSWVTQALDFVEGDGSLGIHNYAYVDAILDAVFAELGLGDTTAVTETSQKVAAKDGE